MRAFGFGFKRAFDFVFAGVSLVLLSPVMVCVGLAVLALMGRPIFFRQQRPGLNGVSFSLIKFRTMRSVADAAGRDIADGERLTSLGRFLRRSSVDELPELWNVFRGEMSIVGPRPLLLEYLPLYSSEQRRRHEMRPGLTGLAQVAGRNAIDWDKRLALDVWYIDHWSIWLDVVIIWRTFGKVLSGEGVAQPGHATAEKFTGSRL